MDHYVYVYIDPRNHEEFYYGKGKGPRKLSHLKSDGDNDKFKRIDAIRAEGLEPIIRVIARGLTSEQALLVEKTLLWKLGKSLTNISTGAYADKFRPHDKIYLDLSGFDYQSGVYYFNIGEGEHRLWVDERKFGFISAGGGAPQWREAILKFNVGDVFAAYLRRKGFVGIGRITAPAKRIRDVKIKGRPLVTLPLVCKGMSYRSGIYYETAEQKKIAEDTIADVDASKLAREGYGGRTGSSVLGGGAGTSGSSGELPGRLHLSFCAAKLEAPAPDGSSEGQLGA